LKIVKCDKKPKPKPKSFLSMKTICLYFQVHQPYRLRRYRFFDIGDSDYYYDDNSNSSIVKKVAYNCYLPANKVLLDLLNKYRGKFRVSFSITGTAIDQFNSYAPEVTESFKKLARTGYVEFLGETYSHSLAALKDNREFKKQVEKHSDKITELFGQRPKTFRNTELIYSDEMGAMISRMGFKAILAEGADHILKGRCPNKLYSNDLNPELKVLLRNYRLSDDIAFRFSDTKWSEWPLTAEKYVSWIDNSREEDEIINLFMDYETFGEHQKEEMGILRFLKSLPSEILKSREFNFMTPSMVVENYNAVSTIKVPYPVSWADKERDLSAWLGNDMQKEAFCNLYDLSDKVSFCSNKKLLKDWEYLQTSDHFYYMSTKSFSDGDVHAYFNPYATPYDAFMNYMNVLNDFSSRLDRYIEVRKKIFSIRKSRKTIEV